MMITNYDANFLKETLVSEIISNHFFTVKEVNLKLKFYKF